MAKIGKKKMSSAKIAKQFTKKGGAKISSARSGARSAGGAGKIRPKSSGYGGGSGGG